MVVIKRILSVILICLFLCCVPYTAGAFDESMLLQGYGSVHIPAQLSLRSVSEPANGVALTFAFNTDFDSIDPVIVPQKSFTVVAYSASDRSHSLCSRTVSINSDTFSGEFSVVFPKFYFLNDHEYIFNVYGTVNSLNNSVVLNACNEPKDLFRSNGIAYNLSYDDRIFYSATIKESGYYEFIPNGLNNYTIPDTGRQIGFHSYPSGGSVSEHIKYYEEGTEVIFTATSEKPAVVSTVFQKVDYVDEECLNDNPSKNGDLVYSIKKNSGLRRIKIVTYGTYSAKIENDDNSYCPFYLYDENHNMVSNIGHSFGVVNDSFILEPGYYYVDTNRGNSSNETTPDEANLNITYTLPEEIKSDTLYKLNSEESGFYTLNIPQPGYVELNTISGSPDINLQNGNYLSESPLYMPCGTYILEVYMFSESEFSIEYSRMNSVNLDAEATPTHNNGMNYFLAFCAPESGEYKFDFSQSGNQYSYKAFDSEDSTELNVVYRTMKKDQWVLISCDQSTRLTVRKHEPAPVAIQANNTVTIPLVHGEILLYSYTPANSAQHFLELDNKCNVSIYTENTTIFSGSSENLKPFFLQGGENVYIKIQSDEYSQWSETLSMTLTVNSIINIENDVTFDLNDNLDTFCSFSAKETGYYNLEITKEGYSDYLFFAYVGGNEYYIGEYSNIVNALAYIEKDTPLVIKFNSCGSGNYCTAKIKAELVETTPIMCDIETMVDSNSTYLFSPDNEGVYVVHTEIEAGSTSAYGVETVVSDSEGFPLTETVTDNSSLIACRPGATYAIRFFGNDKITIRKLPVEKITTNQEYKVLNQSGAFIFTPDADTKYHIENTAVNTELYVYANNKWNKTVREFGSVIISNSDSDIYIAALTANCSDGMSSPQANFKITPDYNNSEQALSVIAEDFYKIPEDYAIVDLKFTAPVGSSVKVGVEILYDNGTVVPDPQLEILENTEIGYTYMYLFGHEFETGKTYTLKPYICYEADSQNKIYGEEKTFTYGMQKNIITLKKRTTPVTISMQDNYTIYNKIVYMEFTCPQDASKTYFTMPSFAEDFYLYDQNNNYINVDKDEHGLYAQLEPGKKYYISAFFRKEGTGTVCVSCLPDEIEPISNITVHKTLQTVTYTYEPQAENAQIMIVALGDNNIPLSICVAPSVAGENIASVKNLNEANNLKIFCINKTNLQPFGHMKGLKVE